MSPDKRERQIYRELQEAVDVSLGIQTGNCATCGRLFEWVGKGAGICPNRGCDSRLDLSYAVFSGAMDEMVVYLDGHGWTGLEEVLRSVGVALAYLEFLSGPPPRGPTL